MTRLEKWIYFCTHEYGCVLCRRAGLHSPADYHHMLSGGRRMGDFIGFGLCPPHHRGGANVVSRDHNLRTFEITYGPESEMLTTVQTAYELRMAA